jgi:hypothetical protein
MDPSAIVELRQYTTFPGKRDTLIALFEREFVESQEATGMSLVGQFRDAGDANRFVWMRSFVDMVTRGRALEAFYTGPVWRAHRDAANATMYDSDNVLLLRPARPGSGFALAGMTRAAVGATPAANELVVLTIYAFARPVTDAFAQWFHATLVPVFERAGATTVAELVSERSANTFPRLPVREGEEVFVWVARFPDRAAYDRYLSALAGDAQWSGSLFARLHDQVRGRPEVLLLEPTPRSRLGHRPRAASAPR